MYRVELSLFFPVFYLSYSCLFLCCLLVLPYDMVNKDEYIIPLKAPWFAYVLTINVTSYERSALVIHARNCWPSWRLSNKGRLPQMHSTPALQKWGTPTRVSALWLWLTPVPEADKRIRTCYHDLTKAVKTLSIFRSFVKCLTCDTVSMRVSLHRVWNEVLITRDRLTTHPLGTTHCHSKLPIPRVQVLLDAQRRWTAIQLDVGNMCIIIEAWRSVEPVYQLRKRTCVQTGHNYRENVNHVQFTVIVCYNHIDNCTRL